MVLKNPTLLAWTAHQLPQIINGNSLSHSDFKCIQAVRMASAGPRPSSAAFCAPFPSRARSASSCGSLLSGDEGLLIAGRSCPDVREHAARVSDSHPQGPSGCARSAGRSPAPVVCGARRPAAPGSRAGGTKLARIRPSAEGRRSRSASFTSRLRPGTLRMCCALAGPGRSPLPADATPVSRTPLSLPSPHA